MSELSVPNENHEAALSTPNLNNHHNHHHHSSSHPQHHHNNNQMLTPSVGANLTTPTPNTAPVTPGATGAATTAQAADMAQFVPYLRQLVAVLIDAGAAATSSELERCLADKSSVECVRKFIADPQTRNLIVQKYQTKGMSVCLYN